MRRIWRRVRLLDLGHHGQSPWPEVPELDLIRRDDHADVQLVLNSAGMYRSEAASGYRVYVHVKWSDAEGDRRVTWLAEQAGLRILGPGEIGW